MKRTVNDRLIGVQKELSSILGFFKGYDEDQRQKKGATLKKGLFFFENLLKIDVPKIIKAIEEEINGVQVEIDKIKAKKTIELSDHIFAIIANDLSSTDSNYKTFFL